ncbi:unnamed protein product [Mycena citricolor]|uniref:Replication protein A subunit n=1 Tax=Mycena citricolor TaxID=2018698 RepID=A0AAD2HNL5_9AGAR|nr:unnamed protein product [Mycena citricolor]
MSLSDLSKGSCDALQNAAQGDASVFDTVHTLQVLSVRVVNQNSTGATVPRFRIIVSDGEHFVQAMLATQLNTLVNEDGNGPVKIKKNTIVNVTKMTCNIVQGKRLLIILGLEFFANATEKLGNPVAFAGTEPAAAGGDTPSNDHLQKQQQQQQPSKPPVQQSRPAQSRAAPQQGSSSSHSSASIFPIEGLSPYQNNWTIKARVVQKSDLKHYTNAKGEGKLFNVTLMDETGEIRGTGFNAVADDLFDRFELNKVYFISKARVNIAKKQFSHLTNEYELGFDRNTQVEECTDTVGLPVVQYHFVPLNGLDSQPKDSMCDVLAIAKETGGVESIKSKATGKDVIKRDVTLVDSTGFSVRMTLWGKQAEQFEGSDQVIAFKSVKVGDYNGRSLSFFSSSSMQVNPDTPEAHALRGWYDNEGASQTFAAQPSTGEFTSFGGFSRDKIQPLAEIKTLELGRNEEKPDYFSTRATVVFMKNDNMWYPACQTENCNKKVSDESGNGWFCEKCQKTWPEPNYRYIMSVASADWSDQAWLQGFNDVGELVLGKTANELQEMKQNSETEFGAFMQAASCQTFNFYCRAKTDSYNGQPRIRYGISKILPLNYKEEATVLRDLLQSPWGRNARLRSSH